LRRRRRQYKISRLSVSRLGVRRTGRTSTSRTQDRQLSPSFEVEDHNLVPSRGGELQGFIFGAFSQGSAARDFLGDMRFFIGRRRRSGKGLEFSPGARCTPIRHWKLQLDNGLDPFT